MMAKRQEGALRMSKARGGKAHAEGAWLGRANNNDGQRLTYSPIR
jgi:hypothetical protein